MNGCFIARTLSYEGVTFTHQHVAVSAEFQQRYDAAAAVWVDAIGLMQQGVEQAKATGGGRGGRGSSAKRAAWAAHLRFFRQLCTAAKVDHVHRLAVEALQRGQAVVIGLQSTGEARTEAYVADNGGEDASFDSFAEPAGFILSNLIEKHIPPGAERQALLQRAAALKLPTNPLDDLLDRLGGPDRVAEMTGRRRRMVRCGDGGFRYLPRTMEDAAGGQGREEEGEEEGGGAAGLDSVNILEKEVRTVLGVSPGCAALLSVWLLSGA